MSPSLILSSSSMSKMILTLPEAVPGLAPRPLTMTFLSPTAESSLAAPLSSPKVVIGLACNKNKLPFSKAHSVSIGSP